MDRQTVIDTENISFGYNETTHATKEYALHCHNYYELYFFMEGDVDYLVEGQRYAPTPNSLLLLAPGVFHGVRINGTSPYRRFTVHFSQEVLSLERRGFLLSAFASRSKAQGQQVYFEGVDRFDIPAFANALLQYKSLEADLREQLIPLALEALLSRVVFMYETEGSSNRTAGSDTVSEIIWYLNQNLQKDITLDHLSEKFFISKHHLNKVFRKATGTTVFDYLIRKRISMAQHLLINGFSAQDAAMEAGFDDYSAFYRSYVRVLGHAPSQDKGGGPAVNLPGTGMESMVFKGKDR